MPGLQGIIEGEGCVVVSPKSKTLRLSIEMTDLDILQKVQKIFGETCRLSKRTVKLENPKWKDRYILHLCGPKLPQWLMTIYCLMGTRRQSKIRDALEMWKTRTRKPYTARPRSVNHYSLEFGGIK